MGMSLSKNTAGSARQSSFLYQLSERNSWEKQKIVWSVRCGHLQHFIIGTQRLYGK